MRPLDLMAHITSACICHTYQAAVATRQLLRRGAAALLTPKLRSAFAMWHHDYMETEQLALAEQLEETEKSHEQEATSLWGKLREAQEQLAAEAAAREEADAQVPAPSPARRFYATMCAHACRCTRDHACR